MFPELKILLKCIIWRWVVIRRYIQLHTCCMRRLKGTLNNGKLTGICVLNIWVAILNKIIILFMVPFCLDSHHINYLPCWLGMEYADHPWLRGKISSSSKRGGPEYDTKLPLIVMLQFLRCEKYRVPFHCHYSHIHSDLEW